MPLPGAAVPRVVPPMGEHVVGQIFAQADRDGDGGIRVGSEAFESLVSPRTSTTPEGFTSAHFDAKLASAFLRRADANGDGSVTRNELAGAVGRFDRFGQLADSIRTGAELPSGPRSPGERVPPPRPSSDRSDEKREAPGDPARAAGDAMLAIIRAVVERAVEAVRAAQRSAPPASR